MTAESARPRSIAVSEANLPPGPARRAPDPSPGSGSGGRERSEVPGSPAHPTAGALERRIRLLLVGVIAGLVLSGLTAFPIETELRWLAALLGADPASHPEEFGVILRWLVEVRDAVSSTAVSYPFLAYGTDWLAFAHLVIAVAFVGPLRDPVRNAWVITFGLIACAGVFPLALIAGSIRGIPIWWRLIDCSFGLFCALPLGICRVYVRRLESRAGSSQGAGTPGSRDPVEPRATRDRIMSRERVFDGHRVRYEFGADTGAPRPAPRRASHDPRNGS